MTAKKQKTPIIELKNVTKSFIINRDNLLKYSYKSFFSKKHKKHYPITNLNIKIYSKEIVGFYGPNGVGKSTILKLMAGIMTPDHGKIIIKGKIVPLIDLFTCLHPELSGKENIYINAAIQGISDQDLKKNIHNIIEFSGLENFIHNQVKKFSMGMRARLSTSIALHSNPDILLLDETIAVGDEKFKKSVLKKIKSMKNLTVIIVSHDHKLLKKVCQRIIYL